MDGMDEAYRKAAVWICCPVCDEEVCVGRFDCPEIAEWCRQKRVKDAAAGKALEEMPV